LERDASKCIRAGRTAQGVSLTGIEATGDAGAFDATWEVERVTDLLLARRRLTAGQIAEEQADSQQAIASELALEK
jgi:hypothetical protein